MQSAHCVVYMGEGGVTINVDKTRLRMRLALKEGGGEELRPVPERDEAGLQRMLQQRPDLVQILRYLITLADRPAPGPVPVPVVVTSEVTNG